MSNVLHKTPSWSTGIGEEIARSDWWSLFSQNKGPFFYVHVPLQEQSVNFKWNFAVTAGMFFFWGRPRTSKPKASSDCCTVSCLYVLQGAHGELSSGRTTRRCLSPGEEGCFRTRVSGPVKKMSFMRSRWDKKLQPVKQPYATFFSLTYWIFIHFHSFIFKRSKCTDNIPAGPVAPSQPAKADNSPFGLRGPLGHLELPPGLVWKWRHDSVYNIQYLTLNIIAAITIINGD